MQKMLVSTCVLAFLICVHANGPATARGAEVSVVVRPAAERIRVGDPLFLKVRVVNDNAAQVTFDREFASHRGTLGVEARRVGSIDFTPVLLAFENSSSLTGGADVMHTLEPHEVYVSHEVLLSIKSGTLFFDPGTYEIRARLRDVDGIHGVSRPVRIVVHDTPPAEKDAIERAKLLLFVTVGCYSISNHPGVLARAYLDLREFDLARKEINTLAETSYARSTLQGLLYARLKKFQQTGPPPKMN
jgi:hypothetical protein